MTLDSQESAQIDVKSSPLETNGCLSNCDNSKEDFAKIDENLAPLGAHGCNIDNSHFENREHISTDANMPCDGLGRGSTSHTANAPCDVDGLGCNEAFYGANVPCFGTSNGANVPCVDDALGEHGASCGANSPHVYKGLDRHNVFNEANVPCVDDGLGTQGICDEASSPRVNDGLSSHIMSHEANVPCVGNGWGKHIMSHEANVPCVGNGWGKHIIPHEANAPCVTDGCDCVSHEVNGSGWIRVDDAPVVLPTPAPEKPWPFSKRHTFYLIRIPRSVDEKLAKDISSAEVKLDQAVKKRDTFREALQDKRAIKAEIFERLKPIRDKERAYRDALQGKRMEIEAFSQVLKKTKDARGIEICNSEAELNEKIAEIQFRIQHESISLKEEKQLVREIKLLESIRSKVCANGVANAELMEKMGPGEQIHNRAEVLRKNMDSLRKDHKQIRLECEAIEKELSKVNEMIEELNQLFKQANTLQQDAYATLRELKKKENSKNDAFYQNRRDLQAARELAAQKNLEELTEFCTKKVEEFMGTWNNDAKFRSEYVKSNERSTIRRLGTLDGRSLGPGENPPQISEVEIVPATCGDVNMTAPKPVATNGHAKVSKAPSLQNVMPDGVLDKESLRGNDMLVRREDEGSHSASTTGNCDLIHIDAVENIVDYEAHDAELKEKHRQEQIAKAKEAEERKRRRAEKSELKAQARAKKYAERQEKEREKRAQKKAAASTSLLSEAALSREPLTVVSEITPVLVLEDSSENCIKKVSRSQRRSAVSRRKPLGQDLKGPRPFPNKASLKKSAWPIPLWACVSIAMVFVFALILFLRWQGTF